MNTRSTPNSFSLDGLPASFFAPAFFIISFFYAEICKSQHLLFRERFSNSQSNTYSVSGGFIGSSTTWSMIGSGTDWGSRISGGFMEITNDASTATNMSGWTFTCFDNSKLAAPWTSSLINNTGIISWTFNMRQSRTDPSGFAIGNYGIAFILAGSNNMPFNSGFGYAVILGQAGTSDPLRLIRYNNGLSGTLTNIIVSNTIGFSDFGNEYLSVEVRYFSASNQWELLLRNDGSGGFIDPAAGLLISQGSAIDGFYTSFSNLTFTGCYWCGNTATAQNALFDNIQISSGCSNSMLYYRTKKSGAWHQAENWEMCTEEYGDYRAACFYPNGTNAIKVLISQGDSIQIENNIHINTNHLIIDSGGTCIMNDNASINIANGNPNGADLEIQGSFIDNANAGYGINFIANSGAAWVMGANAHLIRTNNSSAIPYRDNYQNGMNNIPSTANWIIRYQGKNVPFTTIATLPCPCSSSFPSATFYPNLIFESKQGTWNTASSIGSRFNGTNAYANIKGNLIIGGTGTDGVHIYNENTNTIPMLVEGDLIINSNSVLSNYNSLYPNETGTGFEVRGNLIANGTLNISGSGKLILSGDKKQLISGNGYLHLKDLVINNNSGFNNSITLNRPVSINGELRLINGIVSTDSVNLLTLTSGATASGGSFRSFISGPMQKIGSSDFIFPVGKPAVSINYDNTPPVQVKVGGYRPVAISNLAEEEKFIAEYHLSNPYNLGGISQPASSAGLQSISRCEYWDLKAADGTASASVTLSWSDNEYEGRSMCNIGSTTPDSSHAVVVPYFNGQWGDQYATFFGRTNAGSPDSLFIRTITWNGKEGDINIYDKFVIGSTNFSNAPLLFKIRKFNAINKIKHIDLEFEITQQDELIKSIVIQRSRNGINFTDLKYVIISKGMNSYKVMDSIPYCGETYYRLRITDHLRNIHYSEIQKVMMEGKETGIIIAPNPAKDMISVRINRLEKANTLFVINSIGKIVIRQQMPAASNMINLTSLTRGIYFVRIEGREKTLCGALIKE